MPGTEEVGFKEPGPEEQCLKRRFRIYGKPKITKYNEVSSCSD